MRGRSREPGRLPRKALGTICGESFVFCKNSARGVGISAWRPREFRQRDVGTVFRRCCTSAAVDKSFERIRKLETIGG